MSERFIKFIPSEKTDWLMAKYPIAFLLLCLVAQRAIRTPNHPSGLLIGEAFIGDHESIGATRQQYRSALANLVRMKYLTICETCRTRKKSTTESTTGITTIGTKVRLLNSDIWDINSNGDNQHINHRINHRPTTDQPPTNHEQECKEVKNVKKTTTTTSPSSMVAVAVVSPKAKQIQEAAVSCKAWLDKQATVSRKRKIGREYEETTWGNDWILPLKTFEKLIAKYGYEQFIEHMNYMVDFQNKFDQGKGKTQVSKPESFLRKACNENWALAKTEEKLVDFK